MATRRIKEMIDLVARQSPDWGQPGAHEQALVTVAHESADGAAPCPCAVAAEQGAPVPTLVADDGEVAYLYFVLNFGADGWELVQVAPGMNPENLVGYFKRPIQ